MSEQPQVELHFLGGASEIGASSTLLKVAGVHLLIDCGIRFKGDSALPDLAPLNGLHLDAILITHAHTDHTGALPILAEAFPGVPIYATPPTIDLVKILVRDALRLMNSPDRERELPLYSQRQAEKLFESLVPQPANIPLSVGGLEINFSLASHILGAAMIHIQTPAGNLLFTGDFSADSQRSVPALDPVQRHCDLVICEATYGDRLHENRSVAEARMVKQIAEVFERDARVLIPAFAIGRAQEILLILKEAMRKQQLPKVPVFVDGMVRAVCDVYQRHEKWVSRGLRHLIRKEGHGFYGKQIQRVGSYEERQKVLEHRPAIVVASSGMLSGGASSFYAGHFAPDERDAIFLTGYQDEESPGRRLLNLTQETGPRNLKLGDRTVEVKCRFDTYGLSAHADRMQMVALLDKLRPRTVILVHGDQAAKETFADTLNCNDVVLANNGESLSRRYRLRAGRPKPLVRVLYQRSLDELDFEAARDLLGPPGAPVNGGRIAQEWFGSPPTSQLLGAFIARLEELGLIARDDKRRAMLWVLAPGESEALKAEAELEESLKVENPKGRLLELCQHFKIDPPTFERHIRGAYYVSQVHLQLEGQTHSSEPWKAASQKAADELSARALLKKLIEVSGAPEIIQVSPHHKAQLSTKNPKGDLLELLVKRRDLKLRLEALPSPGGFRAQAHLKISAERSLETACFVAPQKKLSEQAAAEAMLKLIKKSQLLEKDSQAALELEKLKALEKLQKRQQRDPRVRLNEASLRHFIYDFGYGTPEISGPIHQLSFSLSAWAISSKAELIEGPKVQAAGKKDAQKLAADELLSVLFKRGLIEAGAV